MPNNEIALDLLRTFGKPIAAPSANKFGHVSPTKAEHVYKDFYQDSSVLIIDGGSCSFGIESTVLKVTTSTRPSDSEHSPYTMVFFDLLILRKGGISLDNLLETVRDLGIADRAELQQVAKKHFKSEDENLEAPGQFLRHYSPDIVSYLFTGVDAITRPGVTLESAVVIDFAATFTSLQPEAKYYYDLSPEGDFIQAISRVYDVLRWAETKSDASCVLIIHLLELSERFDGAGKEHMEALFDRLFRATSG